MAPPPWAQRAVLGAALAALFVAVLVLGPVASARDAGTPALVTRLLETSLAELSQSRAPGILGVLMLAIAAAFGCLSLERRIGDVAPLLVALLIFGSGSWALVWADGAALTPLALAVTAFALAYGGERGESEPGQIYEPPEGRRRRAGRWLLVGLLLAELVPTNPLLAGLLVPAWLALPKTRRGALLSFLLGGFTLGVAAELMTGGPGLLTEPIGVAEKTISLDPLLVGRNLVNLLAGRNTGLLVGFTPVLLLLLLGLRSVGRPWLARVSLLLPVIGVLLMPFDYAADWLNLSFLAVYGALWHLPYRQPRRWQWIAAVLLCGLAVWPLWAPPRASVAEGGVGLAGGLPRRYLPYELTLRTLPNRGEALPAREGLGLRAVAGCRLLDESNRFELDGDGPARIWIAAADGVRMVGLELGPGAPSSIEVSGAAGGRTVFRPDGRVGFEVLLNQPRGRHRLWFGERSMALHLIEIRLPDWQGTRPLRFQLLAAPQP